MNNLGQICEALREDLEERNAARDHAIVLSRQLVRQCSESIRAIHRRDLEAADRKLIQVKDGANELKLDSQRFPGSLLHRVYTRCAQRSRRGLYHAGNHRWGGAAVSVHARY